MRRSQSRSRKATHLQERAGGNYGAGTQELQRRNYVERKELERQRSAAFSDAIALFEQKRYQDALIAFENVVGQEPKNFIGDRFEKVTSLFIVSQYNVACCYACLGAIDAGLEALGVAMSAGFDDYKKIRSDPSLSALQGEAFNKLLDKYDEPWINDSALKMFGGFFGGGKK